MGVVRWLNRARLLLLGALSGNYCRYCQISTPLVNVYSQESFSVDLRQIYAVSELWKKMTRP
jgi:hypothetical protein